MERERLVEELVRAVGGRFSTALGIELAGGDPGEIFNWFLASVLFGTRISESVVVRTYREFARRGILSCARILEIGWGGLVEVLDAGGYVRYDEKTATKLVRIAEELQCLYHGDLTRLHEEAQGPRDLEAKFQALPGVGPVTVNIFLRELRGIWAKADPLPSDLALLAARNLGLVRSKDRAQALAELKEAVPESGPCFADIESALVRLAKGWCRKGRHQGCPMEGLCPSSGRSITKEG